MKTLLSRAALAAAAIAFGLSGAYAGQATTSLSVSLTVTSTCTVSAIPIAFGSSDLQSDVKSTGSITVACGTPTQYTVSLDKGKHPLWGGRTLQIGNNQDTAIVYEIYTDASRTIPWNDKDGLSAKGTNDTITLFGLAKASTTPQTGDYSDSIAVTLNY